MIAAMILRIVVSVIVLICYYLEQEKAIFSNDRLIDLQMQTLSLSIPYYFYVMVTLSLNFSAVEFSKSIRALLKPGSMLTASQDFVEKSCKLNVRAQYIVV